MTETNLEPRVNRLETKVSVIETKIDMFIDEMKDFRQEMRDRDNRRAAEIAELRQKHDADINAIRTNIETMNDKIDGISKHANNLTVAAIVGIGAISVSVVGFVISAIIK